MNKIQKQIIARAVEELAVAEKIKIVKFYSSKDCKKNKDSLYIFGDNTIRTGNGGQAIIRYEENSTGIITKRYPNNKIGAFFYDSEFEAFKKFVDFDIKKVIQKSINYKYLIFPKDGIGTGLARLKENAPKCFDYLNELLLIHFKFNNNRRIRK